jgi:hypothetical protein
MRQTLVDVFLLLFVVACSFGASRASASDPIPTAQPAYRIAQHATENDTAWRDRFGMLHDFMPVVAYNGSGFTPAFHSGVMFAL